MIRVPVLAYHRIGEAPAGCRHPDTYVHPRAFARQLALLKLLGFEPVTPLQYERNARGEDAGLPRKPILITFDDGSSTVHSHALPLLKTRGFTAALFMVASQLGAAAAWDGEEEDGAHRQLTAAELKALRAEGWTIGSHTRSHARLTTLAPAAAADELKSSKAALEAALGEPVTWFAYPYGDYDPALREAVAEAGYGLAFATERGDGHPLSASRRIIGGRTGLLRFLRRLRDARRLAEAAS